MSWEVGLKDRTGKLLLTIRMSESTRQILLDVCWLFDKRPGEVLSKSLSLYFADYFADEFKKRRKTKAKNEEIVVKDRRSALICQTTRDN